MPELSEFVLGKWVREQLEKGDDPEILKTTLKNRGLDPSVVGHVVASLKKNTLPKKEPAAEKKELLKTSYFNNSLKDEVDKILSAPQPVEKENVASAKFPKHPLFAKPQKNACPEKIPETPIRESIFSILKNRIFESLPQGKIKFPSLSSPLFGRIVIIAAIIIAILIFALLVSYGLDWYAGRMARNVLD